MGNSYGILYFSGKNTVLRKFHISVHLMTSVDREGIVSKKSLCGVFDFMPLLKSYDNFKKLANYQIYAQYLLFVISKWYRNSLTRMESSLASQTPPTYATL